MSNNIRQYTFYLEKSDKNLIYADIYNNKKTYKVDMSKLSPNIDKSILIPIKKYEASNNDNLNTKLTNETIQFSQKDKLFINKK